MTSEKESQITGNVEVKGINKYRCNPSDFEGCVRECQNSGQM